METLDITPIKKDVDKFLYDFQEVEILSKDHYTTAGDIIKQVQNKIKKLDEQRLNYTRPLDESKKRIMDDFKQITAPLEEFVTTLKGKMLKWYRAEQERLDAEQKKLEEKAMAEAKANKQVEVTVPIVNEVKTHRGDVATATAKKVWKFELLDVTKIPREYMSVNEVAIRRSIMDGVRSIDGIRIYQEDTIAIR